MRPAERSRPGKQEPDDHIGLELAFLGELIVAALDALDAEVPDAQAAEVTLAAAAAFLQEHLSLWAPGFAALVAEHARTDLYRGAGLLLLGALPQLAGILGV